MVTRASLIATLVVVSFFAGITGIRLAYTLAYVLLLLLLVAWLWSAAIARRLHVARDSPNGVFAVGDGFSERFTVRNGAALPMPYCEVHDHSRMEGYAPGRACALGAGDAVTWTARGVFTRRGRHRLGPLEARFGDPFGLFPRTVRIEGSREVLVYPPIHHLGDVGAGWAGGSGGDVSRGRPIDVAPDVSTVREYDPSDGLSRIHWASVAKTGRLMSRTYDTRHSADMLVVLDGQRGSHVGHGSDSSFETAVSIAASVCHSALARGQAVGLVCNDVDHTAIGAGRGEAQRLRLLGHLAVVADDGPVPLADMLDRHAQGWRGRGGLVVITASRDQRWVETLVDAGVRGQRHLAVVVDPASWTGGEPFRAPAAWRLALDWWVVRRGDVLGTPLVRDAAAR